MQRDKTYHEQRNESNIKRLRELLNELPPLCSEYFRGIDHSTSVLTRLNYAYDLRIFFEFLTTETAHFKGIKVSDFSLEDIRRIKVTHIEMFLSHLTLYSRPDNPEIEHKNKGSGKYRKLSAVRSFFNYLFKKGYINGNVADLVETPKIEELPIVRLEADEVANVIDIIESGEGLTESQKKYHEITKTRDIAIFSLFLGTGIRISELVGLNISDLDFDINGFKVTRKGGNQVILYFGDEVREALLNYLEERKTIQPLPGSEDALFLSIQRRRISTHAVQKLVKKYTKLVAPLKEISPHKLRSTYGTNLYRETGDIYLVAEVLGHKDVNTTKKHYAAISDEQRRAASRVIKLRK